jgi:hypothetical protein
MFASTLSGNGSTIAMAYRVNQNEVHITVHRYIEEESWVQLGKSIISPGSLDFLLCLGLGDW